MKGGIEGIYRWTDLFEYPGGRQRDVALTVGRYGPPGQSEDVDADRFHPVDGVGGEIVRCEDSLGCGGDSGGDSSLVEGGSPVICNATKGRCQIAAASTSPRSSLPYRSWSASHPSTHPGTEMVDVPYVGIRA